MGLSFFLREQNEAKGTNPECGQKKKLLLHSFYNREEYNCKNVAGEKLLLMMWKNNEYGCVCRAVNIYMVTMTHYIFFLQSTPLQEK